MLVHQLYGTFSEDGGPLLARVLSTSTSFWLPGIRPRLASEQNSAYPAMVPTHGAAFVDSFCAHITEREAWSRANLEMTQPSPNAGAWSNGATTECARGMSSLVSWEED